MISVCVTKNRNDNITGFTVKNHGSSFVCAAVSILTINTVNCIEHFIAEPMDLNIDEDGAYISCSFPRIKEGIINHDVDLLLNAMLFGLRNVMLEHPNDIFIKEVSE